MLKQITIGVAFLVFALSDVTACRAGDEPKNGTSPLLASMVGAWKVTDVLWDSHDTDQGPDSKYIAPKYLGRVFTITANSLLVNVPSVDPCKHATLTPSKSTASDLVANSISTRLFSSKRPTPEDMRLPVATKAPVDVFYLSCDGKLRAKDPGMSALADLSNVTWIISLDDSRLAISWHEQTILVLGRVTTETKPAASFDCTKAGTAVEKTICSSVGLAAYDKSLAQAYALARDYYRGVHDSKAAEQLKIAQREWLKQRNACGSDKLCLEKVINLRIDDVIYDLGDYTYQNR